VLKYKIKFTIPKQTHEYIVDVRHFDIALNEAKNRFVEETTIDDILQDTTYEYEMIEEDDEVKEVIPY
tara:strand:- start:113 stop:316 length:204 start_codon:yes stop_codon:yes gene_type:complete